MVGELDRLLAGETISGDELMAIPTEPERLQPLIPRPIPVEQLVKEEGFSPPAAAAIATAQELGIASATFINELALGVPGEIARRRGFEIPRTITTGGEIAEEISGLAGFIGGPVKIAAGVAKRIPGLRRVFTRTAGEEVESFFGKVTAKKAAKQITAETAVLGIAEMLRTPEGELVGIAKRGEAGLKATPAGLVFGTVGLIPNRPVRVLASSSVFGVPSLMQNKELPKLIADFGIGAFFGVKGISGRRARIGKDGKITEKGLTELRKLGMEQKDVDRMLKEEAEATEIMRKFLKETITARKAEETTRLQRILNEGADRYTPPTNEAKYRTKTIKEIKNRMDNIKKEPIFDLRGDNDTAWVVERLTKKGKQKIDLKKISTRGLFNLRERLEADKIKINDTIGNLPLVGGVLNHGWTKAINLYDLFNRPGFALLKKLGHGDAYLDKGITNMAFLSASERAQFSNWWESTRSRWLASLGNDPIRARDVFIAADGGMTLKTLEKFHGKKAVQVVERWRVVSDMLLEHINNNRALYGEEPIKRLGNKYITHVMDAEWKKYGGGLDLPWNMTDVVVPKKKFFPFEKERHDDPNYIRDFWIATDAYVNAAGRSITDQPIRRANQFLEFATKMERLEKQGIIETGVDWGDIAKLTNEYSQDLAGKKIKVDQRITDFMHSTIDRILPDRFKITRKIKGKIQTNPQALSNAFTSLVIMEQLGGRPKPAIRNFGQHSLIIGQTGFRPLIEAILTTGKERQDILRLSKFLPTRRFGGAVGEAEAFQIGRGRIQRWTKRSLGPFSFADRKNVENAFVAGFKKARMKDPNISDAEAAKVGDAVAGRTQFPYIMENRSRLARGRFLGLGRTIGRPLSLFTTWPANHMEFVIASAQPEHRNDLMKYGAFSLAFYAAMRAFDIKGDEYTGISAPADLLKQFRGDLPMLGIMKREIPGTDPVLFREIGRLLDEDEEFSRFLFYKKRQEDAIDKIIEELRG